MSKKTTDKRLHFIAQALNRRLTENADLANKWYISNKAEKISNEDALKKFKEWLDYTGD